MIFTPEHIKILSDLVTFSKIDRYRGMLPAKMAAFYAQDILEEMIDQNLVESFVVSYPCGSEQTFYKMTKAGRKALEEEQANTRAGEYSHEQAEDHPYKKIRDNITADNLQEEHNHILNDIFHLSKVQRNGGLTPMEELQEYGPYEINTLYAKGYIIRVKVTMRDKTKRKGLILSDKGIKALELFEKKKKDKERKSSNQFGVLA